MRATEVDSLTLTGGGVSSGEGPSLDVNYSDDGTPRRLNDCQPVTVVKGLVAVEFILPMTALVVLNIAILAGNSLVIMAVFTHAKLRRSITNRFIVSLAVADMMVGAIVLPFSSANEVRIGYLLWWSVN